VLGLIPEIVLHQPLHTKLKEKARYHIGSGLSFVYLVPERGIEPPTFSLRMLWMSCLPLLMAVDTIYKNQHLKQIFWTKIQSLR
jgi:hypothetical protein